MTKPKEPAQRVPQSQIIVSQKHYQEHDDEARHLGLGCRCKVRNDQILLRLVVQQLGATSRSLSLRITLVTARKEPGQAGAARGRAGRGPIGRQQLKVATGAILWPIP